MDYNSLSVDQKTLIVMLVLWELAWKGAALWRAGRNGQPGWFVALLVISSAGILPIIYLLTHPERATGDTKAKGGRMV